MNGFHLDGNILIWKYSDRNDIQLLARVYDSARNLPSICDQDSINLSRIISVLTKCSRGQLFDW